jgi:hypothetical protein
MKEMTHPIYWFCSRPCREVHRGPTIKLGEVPGEPI